MSNTFKVLIVVSVALAAMLWIRHESNTANENFDLALTADWSSADHAQRWERVEVEEEVEDTSMDDVFHAAIMPRQTRTASASQAVKETVQ